jgi:hypothetical protein
MEMCNIYKIEISVPVFTIIVAIEDKTDAIKIAISHFMFDTAHGFNKDWIKCEESS